MKRGVESETEIEREERVFSIPDRLKLNEESLSLNGESSTSAHVHFQQSGAPISRELDLDVTCSDQVLRASCRCCFRRYEAYLSLPLRLSVTLGPHLVGLCGVVGAENL